jgi:hypothetical protein
MPVSISKWAGPLFRNRTSYFEIASLPALSVVRSIKTGVPSEAEAKAIAQEDFNQDREA